MIISTIIPVYGSTTFSFTYPSEAMDVNSTADRSTRYLTTITQRAASEIPLVFGINVVAGNMFDGLKDLAGTNVNENPDPYIWNFNYCYPDAEQQGSSGEAAHELPEGTYYNNISSVTSNSGNGLYWSGGANAAYVDPVDELGGVGYAVGLRTDVSIGFNTDLIDQIDQVRSLKEGDEFYQDGDENYSPVIVDVQAGSATSRMYFWSDMGEELSEYLDDHPELATRYDDPEQIGVDVEYYSAGIPYYISSLIASGKIEKKTAAYVNTIDQYTLNCVDPGTLRNIKNVKSDCFAEARNFNFITGSFTIDDLVEHGVDVIILGSNGYGYTSAQQKAGASSTSSKKDILTALAQAGVEEDDMPLIMDSNTIGVSPGTNGNNYAPTVCLFIPYIQVYAYMDELEDVNSAINPVAMVRYMFEKFFHIKKSSSEDVALYYIGSKWDSVDEDYDTVPDLSSYTYDTTAIEAAMEKGAEYASSGAAEKNGNYLMAAKRVDEPAYRILTELLTETKPDASDEYITIDVDGTTKYLNLTELDNYNGDLSGTIGFNASAVIEYYNTSEYRYGKDLQETLQNYAKRMVDHVWEPPVLESDDSSDDPSDDSSDDPTPGGDKTSGDAIADRVTIDSVSNGTVTVSPEKVKTGDTVTLTVKADEGYEVGSVTVKDAKGNDVAVAAGDSSTYTFILPEGKVTVTTVINQTKKEEPSTDDKTVNFRDVSSGSWFYNAVQFVASRGIFNGTSDTEFSPNSNMTRAMFVTVLGRIAGVDQSKYKGSAFSDVADGQWYSAYVKWANENNIVNGVGEGKFNPDGNITREQMAAILYRYAKFAGISTSGSDTAFNQFADKDSVSAYAKDAMVWATANSIINGTGNGLEPQSNATRAQVAQIVLNASDQLGIK